MKQIFIVMKSNLDAKMLFYSISGYLYKISVSLSREATVNFENKLYCLLKESAHKSVPLKQNWQQT